MATRENAVQFAMGVMRRSTDWQQVQHAMANNDEINAWIDDESAGDELEALNVCQSVIHEAEQRLGDKLPKEYA